MGKRGKRYNEGAQSVDRMKLYDLEEGVQLLKKSASAKFEETVDLAVHLGVDPRHADQNIRGTVSLPHGTGQEIRVAVFAQGDKVRVRQKRLVLMRLVLKISSTRLSKVGWTLTQRLRRLT